MDGINGYHSLLLFRRYQTHFDSKLYSTNEYIGKVSRKYLAVLLDFVQITLTLPLIWTTCTTFFERQCAKKLAMGLPVPPHPQIDPIYSL